MPDTRFWRWFRAIPIICMLVSCLVTGALRGAPATWVRSVLLPVEHTQIIKDASSRHGVDPYLVCAVIKCESGWNEQATSQAGAVGLMQLMPDTARTIASMGLVDSDTYPPDQLTDYHVNIEYGCAYLAYLQSQLSSTDEVIAAYNAGLGSVKQWLAQGQSIVSEEIRYPETAVYLARVKNAYEMYKRYYPEGIDA